MNVLVRATAGLLALAFTAALVAASQWPWPVHDDDEARIRLSWRTVSEPLRACRVPTPEELAALPPHMRMEEICERRHRPFRLQVRLDGALVRDVVREPSGARGDRPLYVFEEIPVAPGSHRLEIEFGEAADVVETEVRRPPLRLEQELRLAPREIALVTVADSGERLVLRSRL